MTAAGRRNRGAHAARIANRARGIAALTGVLGLFLVAACLVLQALARRLGMPLFAPAFGDVPALAMPLLLALLLPQGSRAEIAVTGRSRGWQARAAQLLFLLAAVALAAYALDLAPRRGILSDWPLMPGFLLASLGVLARALTPAAAR